MVDSTLPLRLIRLAITYAPQLRFHSDEDYFPSTIEDYLANCELKMKDERGDDRQVAFPATMQDLTKFNSSTSYLKIVNREIRKGNLDRATAYVHILQREQDFDIQYWFFYPWNSYPTVQIGPAKIEIPNLGEHEGDWEHITVRVGRDDDNIRAVYFAAHGDKGRWALPPSSHNNDRPKFKVTEDGRPIVWVAWHTHACYWSSDDQSYKTPVPAMSLVDRPNNDGKRWDTKDLRPHQEPPSRLAFVTFDGADIAFASVAAPPWLTFRGLWGDANRKNGLTAGTQAKLVAAGAVAGLTVGTIFPLLGTIIGTLGGGLLTFVGGQTLSKLQEDGSGGTGPAIPNEGYSPYGNGDPE